MKYLHKIKKYARSAPPWMVVFLLAVEIALHMPGLWDYDRVTEGSTYKGIHESAETRSPAPRVTVLGSSRIRNAIIPSLLEDELNLEKGDVSNMAYRGATPQDFLNLYRNEPEYFSNLDVILLEVGANSFNWTTIVDEGVGDQRFRRYSNLNDRFSVPEFNTKVDYVTGHFLRTWDIRSAIRLGLMRFARGEFDFSVHIAQNGQIDVFSREVEGGPDPQESINRPHDFDFRDFRFSDYQLSTLTEFIRIMEAENVSVLLIETPLSPLFTAEVDQHYPAEDLLWRERVEESLNRTIISLTHSDPTCRNWVDCYYDYGHVNPVGANSISKSAIEHIASAYTQR